ncbi:MAG: hypothetical protein V3U71_02610 [Cocleimonas sp.]
MSDSENIKNTKDFLLLLFDRFVSILVGLFAFVAIKITLTATTGHFIDLQNKSTLSDTLNVLLFIFSIIIAFRYMKRLNTIGSKVSRIMLRVLTLLAGVIAILLYRF